MHNHRDIIQYFKATAAVSALLCAPGLVMAILGALTGGVR